MPLGRPTDYRPEYCESVQEFGRMGKSIAWMAAELGVARSTIQLWEKEIPEFSSAMTQARLYSQQWWEDMGQEHLMVAPGQGTFQASVWSRSMAARFPEDWREKSEVKHEGGLTIQVTPTENDL